MKILFLGYWGANEGLSVSTIYPHLEVLSAYEQVEKIVYCSIEREAQLPTFTIAIPKVVHIPLHSPPQANVLLNKANDFTTFPKRLSSLIRQQGIDLMICRGAPAGIIGHLVHLVTKIPYWVESFEPHAAYMLESGVWTRWDPRYLIERVGEWAQLRTATAILPVAEGYRTLLKKQGIAQEKLITLPCTVDTVTFAFREKSRQQLRQLLGIAPDAVCGIYVGKFGDMYFDKEAFTVFRRSKQVLHNFFLIILSPQPANPIREKLINAGFQQDEFFVGVRPHPEIPQYLHAADFAYALYRPSPAKRFLSPIKVGEYWAAGLPVLLSDGVGDETEIMAREGGGVLFTLDLLDAGLLSISEKIEATSKTDYLLLAKKYRGRALINRAYKQAFSLTSTKPSSEFNILTK